MWLWDMGKRLKKENTKWKKHDESRTDKKVTQSGLKPKEIKGFQRGFESV